MFAVLTGKLSNKIASSKFIRKHIAEYTGEECHIVHVRPRSRPKSIAKRLRRLNVQYLMPIEDCSTRWLAKHSQFLRERGMRMLISPADLLIDLDDKYRFQHILSQHVRMPECMKIESATTAEKAVQWCEDVGYPVYLKVTYGTIKGNGVVKIVDQQMMRDQLKQIMPRIQSKTRKSRGYVLQQGIDGKVVNPQCIFTQGKLRSIFSTVSNSENVHSIRAADSPHINDELVRMIEAVGRATKYDGMMDIEFIAGSDGYYLMEINPRMSGGIYMVFYHSIGFMNDYIELIRGNDTGDRYIDRTPPNTKLKMYYRFLALRTAVEMNMPPLTAE